MILYSNGCPSCRILKNKLDDLDIPFIESTDFKVITEAGYRSVPVLQVDGKLYNFNESMQLLQNRQ